MLSSLIFFISLAATAALIGWLFILLHPACPWDFLPVGDDDPLPEQSELPSSAAIIVPARNEADSLPATLPALLTQDYAIPYRVFIVNDRSSDETSVVARSIGEQLGANDKLTVIDGAPLPEGWMGKVWAMEQGARAAFAGGAEIILLTDADILHAPQSLRRMGVESRRDGLGLNSRMARLRCESPAERLLIPAFVHFFNLLYPMRRVNNPHDALAGAAGGCALLSREAWMRLGESFAAIKGESIDDVNLARKVKKSGLPIRLSLSRTEVQSLRAYPQLGDIWKMVRRTAFTELRHSWLRLAGALGGLTLLFAVPACAILGSIVCAALGAPLLLCAWGMSKGCLGLAVMGHVYAPAIRFFRLSVWRAFTLPAAAALYGAMTLDSALRHARGLGLQWREGKKG